jgi:hypothetical protein
MTETSRWSIPDREKRATIENLFKGISPKTPRERGAERRDEAMLRPYK